MSLYNQVSTNILIITNIESVLFTVNNYKRSSTHLHCWQCNICHVLHYNRLPLKWIIKCTGSEPSWLEFLSHHTFVILLQKKTFSHITVHIQLGTAVPLLFIPVFYETAIYTCFLWNNINVNLTGNCKLLICHKIFNFPPEGSVLWVVLIVTARVTRAAPSSLQLPYNIIRFGSILGS